VPENGNDDARGGGLGHVVHPSGRSCARVAALDWTLVRRVAVVGNSGSGKTALGRQLASALGVRFVELDAIYHQRDWEPLPDKVFRRRVAEIVAEHAWVVDGSYSAVRDLVWARADTIVWLDLSRLAVTRQIVWRTLSRAITRAELWNGNRESWRAVFSRDPAQSIIRWSWTRHRRYQERFASLTADPSYAHLYVLRITSRSQAQRLVRAVVANAPAR